MPFGPFVQLITQTSARTDRAARLLIRKKRANYGFEIREVDLVIDSGGVTPRVAQGPRRRRQATIVHRHPTV